MSDEDGEGTCYASVLSLAAHVQTGLPTFPRGGRRRWRRARHSAASRHCDRVGEGVREAGRDITMDAFLAARDGRPLDDFPHLVQARTAMFDHLVWWGLALRAARTA